MFRKQALLLGLLLLGVAFSATRQAALSGVLFETTFDCNEWTRFDGTNCSCDGLFSAGGWTTLGWNNVSHWTEETGIGSNIWSIDAQFSRDRMVIEGVEYPEAASPSAINSTNRWYSDSPTLYLYSVGNPANTYNMIGDEEQITSAANYPGGGGGKGQRHWVGDGSNKNTGGLGISFSSPEPEIWFRWYMRYELGFAWSPYLGYDKILYVHGAGSEMITGFYGPDKLSIYGQHTGDDKHYRCYDCGWETIMGGPTSDGQWHLYEIHLKMDTNGSNGVAEWWVDSVLQLSHANCNFGTVTGINWIGIGSNQGSPGNNRTMAVDFDDIAISNTGYIGPLNATDDTTSPTVSITSPIQGQTVSGNTTITANASDNIGVAGVQFKLDGTNLGAEDTTSPYSISWDTTTVSDGSYDLTATGRDAAGNNANSTPVTVTVENNQEAYTILYETWEQNNVNNWDDDFIQGDTHIDTNPVYAGTYAITMESSHPGNYAHFFGDHPGVDGAMVTDVTLGEYYYLSPGFQWPSIGLKLWIMNCFEAWGAGYNLAAGQGKPHTWAPYYMTIAVDSSGQPFGELTRADGLGGPGARWQGYWQNVGSTISLTPGTWTRIKFRLKLNNLGQNDGIFQLWINDELKGNYNNVNFRGNYSQYGWNHLMMSMHGNPSHPQSQWVSRDNILITSQEEYSSSPGGN